MQDKLVEKREPKSKKKVGYIITKGVWGGAQKYVYTLAIAASEKYDVFVICGEGKILKEKLEEKGIRVYELRDLKRDLSLISEATSSFKMLQIVWKEHPDTLHLNSPKAAGFGTVAGMLVRVPNVITTIHGWSFNENRAFWSKGIIYLFSWITTLLSHKTIVIAEKEKEQALKMPFVDKDKIVLIRNGVETIKYIKKPIVQEAILARVKDEKNLTGKEMWLGTISELNKNKGLEYAIKALSKLKTPFAFFIIGEGEERTRLQTLINEQGLQGKVFLVGFLEHANLYLKAFDIFMLTSTKEGLPYTLLEAGQAGLPVIATNVGGVPDIIDNKVNGLLITKAKPGEITQALEYMINKPEERKEFGKKLEEKIEKEFSVEKMIQKTLKLYK